MTIAEREHELFLQARKDPAFIKNLQKMDELSKGMLIMDLTAAQAMGDQQTLIYVKWLIEQTNDYYFMPKPPDEGSSPGIVLFRKDLTGCLVIGLNNPHADFKPYIQTKDLVLELLNVHSFKKGRGFKMITSVIKLAAALKVDVTLLTETADKVSYFEKYGFVNKGRQGADNEFFMVKGVEA